MIKLVINIDRDAREVPYLLDQVLNPAVVRKSLLTARTKPFQVIYGIVFGFL